MSVLNFSVTYASDFYSKSVQMSVNLEVPSAKTIEADLKVRFERKPKKPGNGAKA
jgi:hypothetical protein